METLQLEKGFVLLRKRAMNCPSAETRGQLFAFNPEYTGYGRYRRRPGDHCSALPSASICHESGIMYSTSGCKPSRYVSGIEAPRKPVIHKLNLSY